MQLNSYYCHIIYETFLVYCLSKSNGNRKTDIQYLRLLNTRQIYYVTYIVFNVIHAMAWLRGTGVRRQLWCILIGLLVWIHRNIWLYVWEGRDWLVEQYEAMIIQSVVINKLMLEDKALTKQRNMRGIVNNKFNSNSNCIVAYLILKTFMLPPHKQTFPRRCLLISLLANQIVLLSCVLFLLFLTDMRACCTLTIPTTITILLNSSICIAIIALLWRNHLKASVQMNPICHD